MSDTEQLSGTSSNNGDQTAPSGRFAPGNPGGRGRKEGSRNKATLILDAIADGEAQEVLRKASEAAKAGDLRAIDIDPGASVAAAEEPSCQFHPPGDS
jgi:hypothetical protein